MSAILAERLAVGTRSLTRQAAVWFAARDVQDAKERRKAKVGRFFGGLAATWFVAGFLWALGVLWWILGLGLPLCALVASYGPMPRPGKAPASVAQTATQPTVSDETVDPRRDALLAVLATITAGRTGIHLGRVYEQMRLDYPAYAEQSDKELRALLVACGVPVHQSLTADGVKGRSGIKRADIEAMLTPTPPPLPAVPLVEEEPAHQQVSSSSFPASEPPEGDSCNTHELGDDTLIMLHGEANR
ncbi:hypothetical protein [Actinacidiphila glaucinigra]|uniref:hypothetical protein n=1 Tax=Actinacidiphila glaucinigra TaxID=235986 RepID=UPI0035DD804A